MPKCNDCFRNCDNGIISDRCVEYTGNDITCLGICKGDSLYELEVAIVEKLCAAIDGTGIDLSDVNISCAFLTDILGNLDPTLTNLMQMLVTASCSLRALIQSLQDQIDETYVFDIACLTGLSSTPTRDEIIQALITKLCSVDVRVTNIENDYVKNSDLCGLVTACLGGQPTQYNSRMVPNCPIPYVGSLSNFDNTGKGLTANGFDKIYLMNGLNGTQDWRGRSPIGAINNVPGGALDAAVDPTLPANAGLNYNLNQKVGASSVILTAAQMPSHTHIVSDPGHRHSVQEYAGTNTAGEHIFSPVTGAASGTTTGISITGITNNSSGGSQAHTNLSPMIACYFIVYVP